jgi:hypothetical protein
MTWSYDPALTSDADKVRFLIGDTDTTNQLVSDEAVATMLSLYTDTFPAAAALCDGLATKFARLPTITISGITIRGTERAEQYRITALSLRQQSAQGEAGALGVPFVGGVSISDVQSNQQDTDRMPNKFGVGNMDYPGTINTADGPGPEADNQFPFP